METPAAARRAKRRKPETPKSSEQEGEANISPLPATSAPESSSPGAVGDEPYIQGPPPGAGGEEGDGVDRISSLPDAILGTVRSSLSSPPRMPPAPKSSPPGGAISGAPPRSTSTAFTSSPWMSSLASSPPTGAPAAAFASPHSTYRTTPPLWMLWLRSPALNNLQEIDCWIPYIAPWALQLPPQPPSTFRFSSCLCVATFSQCHLSDDIAQALQFPMLKKLALQGVSISEDSLQCIIAASPVLECLLLRGSFGFHCFRINSASLTSIGVSAGHHPTMTCLEEFIVEDAPCLKRFLYLPSPQSGTRLRVSVISAPNLETLSYRDTSRIALGSMIIEPCRKKEFRVINSTSPACTVKILAVYIFNLSLDVIIDLMRCFPCLEKLYIQSYEDRDKNSWRRKHRNLIKGLDIRLKTVVLNIYYRGIKSQVNFATFFVLNAKMLESMTFDCRGHNVTDRFVSEQHQLLQLEKRASRCARFYFTNTRYEHEFIHINHVHDLSKTDPFECKEAGVGVCAPFE